MENEGLLQTEAYQNAPAQEKLDVQGFHFLTPQDAQKAGVDAGKIAYLSSHVGNTSPQALLAVYEKSIQNKIFATPVGWSFLHGIRQQLLAAGMSEAQLMPIPMTTSFTRPVNPPAQAQPAPAAPEPAKKERRPQRGKKEEKQNIPALVMSVVFNLVLVGLVIAMFMVLKYGETVNMLNYKQQYTNEYAIMKQELQQEIQDKKKELLERERAVTERENALNAGGE